MDKKLFISSFVSVIIFIIGITLRLASSENLVISYNSITNEYEVFKGGIHFNIPLINEITIYDTRVKIFPDIQKSYTVWSSSSDGVQTGLDIRLFYSIDTSNILKLHKNLGYLDYNKFIEPILKSTVKTEIAKYSAIEIWTGNKESISDTMKYQLNEKLKDYGFIAKNFLIEEVKMNPEFLKEVENTAISKQKSEKIKYELEAQKLEAQRKEIEAQSKAKEIEIIGRVLNENPKYIDYIYVDKLSDKVQVIISDHPNFINLDRKNK